jgi:hypothetical protein
VLEDAVADRVVDTGILITSVLAKTTSTVDETSFGYAVDHAIKRPMLQDDVHRVSPSGESASVSTNLLYLILIAKVGVTDD